VIANLGQIPTQLKAVHYSDEKTLNLPRYQRKAPKKKDLVGVDLFMHWAGTDVEHFASLVKQIELPGVKLSMITNRGIKVYPDGFPETFCTDHWRCRFKPSEGEILSKEQIIQLLQNADAKGIDAVKTENLYHFDGKPAYSLGQGQ
jgi:isocitrate dehydrogenase